MNLDALIRTTRQRLDDLREPYLWSDELLTEFANAAVLEACERAWLIPERGNPSVCKIYGTANHNGYALHPSVQAVQRVVDDFTGSTLPQYSSAEIETLAGPNWQAQTAPNPIDFYILGRLLYTYPIVTRDFSLTLWTYRRPFESEAMVNDLDEPPIDPARHRDLVWWMLFEAYSMNDADHFNPKAAAEAEARFTRAFGPRPSARADRERLHSPPHRTVYPRPFGAF